MIGLAFILAATPVAEQMAPASQGKLQCQFPDPLFKTCMSLSKAVKTGPSTYRFETNMLVDPQGPVVVTIKSDFVVRGQEICDTRESHHWSSASITSAGKPLPTASAARHLAVLRKQFDAVGGKVCTQILPIEPGVEKVIARIEGKRVPAADYLMIWVDPTEGWVVGQ